MDATRGLTLGLSSRPIFCDIDGTLTDDGAKPGNPLVHRIEALKQLIARSPDVTVVVWSARGTAYAQTFCERHGLRALAIGKPSCCIDDHLKLFGPSTDIVLAHDFFREEDEAWRK